MKSKTKKIYLATGNEHQLAWQLSVDVSAEQPKYEGMFYLTETKKVHTQRTIWLAGGVDENHEWQLITNVSADQSKFEGNFYLRKRRNDSKTIRLASGREEGWGWALQWSVSEMQCKWCGSFQVENELRKYRNEKRINDNNWARRVFPRQWLQQFEIHHSWGRGETCFFLNHEEHREQDKIIRYANQ